MPVFLCYLCTVYKEHGILIPLVIVQNLKKQIEELAKEIKDIRKSGKTEVAADVLRKILESMQMLKEDAGSPDHTGYGNLLAQTTALDFYDSYQAHS